MIEISNQDFAIQKAWKLIYLCVFCDQDRKIHFMLVTPRLGVLTKTLDSEAGARVFQTVCLYV